jgi:hypothetical protein
MLLSDVHWSSLYQVITPNQGGSVGMPFNMTLIPRALQCKNLVPDGHHEGTILAKVCRLLR